MSRPAIIASGYQNAHRVAHLGGDSMWAMLGGRSMDTSMGFSATDGLPMATRCGGIDPHIPLFLLKTKRCIARNYRPGQPRGSGAAFFCKPVVHLGQACATHSRPHSFDAGCLRACWSARE